MEKRQKKFYLLPSLAKWVEDKAENEGDSGSAIVANLIKKEMDREKRRSK